MFWQVKHKTGETCGHKHRTKEAAEKCLDRLLNWDEDRRRCSSYWYNACVAWEGEKETETEDR